jgi:hypothetical protein
MEFILGEDKETTAFSRIETALETLAIHKEVTSLLTSNNNFNASAGPVLANKVSAFALFTLHCLINKPEFIIIDNAWLDLQYEEIIKILPVLDRELPHTTIIVFARADNNYFKYQHKYEMGPKFKENS